jgi:predicted RNA binding protein YcfA (HicA-like mRNA interferase family)
MPRDAADIAKALLRKGFQEKGGDHRFYHLIVDEKKTRVFTKMSHGKKEVPDNLLSVMARQAGLTRKQFLELVDCPLSQGQYLGILRRANLIE